MTNEDFKKIYHQTRIEFFIILFVVVIGAIIGNEMVVLLGTFMILVLSTIYIIIKLKKGKSSPRQAILWDEAGLWLGKHKK